MTTAAHPPVGKFTTVLLNLPYKTRLIRRYMCSYNAPNLLFPPQELLALGGIVREWKHGEVTLIDAIAENLDADEVSERLRDLKPDLIVSIIGFECFEADMEQATLLKQRFPNTAFAVFGHYPTHFAREILENTPLDYVMLEEPDLNFSELYDCLKSGKEPADVKGIVWRGPDGIAVQKGDGRIADINKLPVPAYELLKNENYYEPFMARPFGLVQSARGCPFQCNYCVKSFGTKLTEKTAEHILDEIQRLIDLHHIRSLRFIDDTFTINKKRVVDICKGMIDRKFNLEWTCLTRTDTLNEEMLIWMKKAGCKRINFGIESGSDRILTLYNKKTDLDEARQNLLLCKKHGIETMGFFIVGFPEETREDFEQSMRFAIDSKLDYIIVGELIPYPGTALYEKIKDQVDFSIFPYRNTFKDPAIKARQIKWEKEFYRRFYMRPGYTLRMGTKMLSNPRELMRNAAQMFRFALTPAGEEDRRDYY